MSLETLEAAGMISRVAWYIRHGYSRYQIDQVVERDHPAETWRTRRALYDAGRAASIAGLAVDDTRGNERLPASSIPGQRPGVTGYRYRIVGTYTSSDGTPERYASFDVLSHQQESHDTLERFARGHTPRAGLDDTDPRRRKQVTTWSYSSFEVQSLERWNA